MAEIRRARAAGVSRSPRVIEGMTRLPRPAILHRTPSAIEGLARARTSVASDRGGPRGDVFGNRPGECQGTSAAIVRVGA